MMEKMVREKMAFRIDKQILMKIGNLLVAY